MQKVADLYFNVELNIRCRNQTSNATCDACLFGACRILCLLISISSCLCFDEDHPVIMNGGLWILRNSAWGTERFYTL